MASRKEYELLFLLNATFGTNYQATFKQAQAALLSYQKEIVELNQAQSDISAYERTKAALEEQTRKLADLKQKLHDVNDAYANGTMSGSDYTSQSAKLNDQITKIEEKIQKYTTRLAELDQALKNDKVNTADLENEKKRLEAKLEELRKKEEETAKAAQELGDKSKSAFEGMADAVVASGILDHLKSLYSAYKECVDISTQFGWEMANVTAIAGASDDEIDKLTEKAKELGATTKYTATEAAEAMGSMAMAGWKTEDMLSGMDGVINLAAAANEDLATTSSIVSDSLAGFGLQASDTSHFADVLAAAATNSNTTVSLIGETFKYAASSAGALGYTVEDLAVAMGVMANRGIKGSMAGTALRTTLSKLIEGATLTSEAFGEYEFSAVNADGTMKSFSETIDELRTKFSQMSEAERVQNAQSLVGSRSYNGLLAILTATDEEYQSLTEKINNCTGAAQEMASVKMDSAQGDLYLMESAVDALKTTLGELTTDELRKFYQVIADVADSVNEFVKENPYLVKALMTFAGTIGVAATGLVTFSAAAKTASLVIGALSAAGLTVAGSLAPVVAIVGGIAAAIGIAVAEYSKYQNRLVDGEHTYKELTENASSLKETILGTADAMKESADDTLATAAVADKYIDRLEAMEAAGDGGAEASEEYRGTLRLLAETLPDVADQIDLENGCILTSTSELRKNTEAWKKNAIAQAYQEQLTELYKKQTSAEIEKQKNYARMTGAMNDVNAAQERYNELVKQGEASGAADEWNHYIKSGNSINTVSEATRLWHEEVEGAKAAVADGTEKVKVYAEAYKEGAVAVNAAGEEIGFTTEAMNTLAESEGGVAEASGEVAEKTSQFEEPFKNIIGRVSELAEAYNEAYQAAYDSVKGQYALWDEVAERNATSIDSITENIKSQTDYWDAYNKDLDTLKGMAEEVSGLSEVIAGFADGSEESVNAIAGMAKAAEGGPEKLQEMVDEYAKLQEAQGETIDKLADYKVDIGEIMDGIVSDFSDDINNMDFSNESTEAARETIQAYVDQANSMGSAVAAAFGRVATVAKSALYGYSNTRSSEEDRLNYGEGYASGTENASRGLHIVGEEGPELVYMNGGEKVLNADDTALALRQSVGNTNNVNVSFNIEGGADTSTVERLKGFAREIEEHILDAISDAQRDSARRVYA